MIKPKIISRGLLEAVQWFYWTQHQPLMDESTEGFHYRLLSLFDISSVRWSGKYSSELEAKDETFFNCYPADESAAGRGSLNNLYFQISEVTGPHYIDFSSFVIFTIQRCWAVWSLAFWWKNWSPPSGPMGVFKQHTISFRIPKTYVNLSNTAGIMPRNSCKWRWFRFAEAWPILLFVPASPNTRFWRFTFKNNANATAIKVRGNTATLGNT